MTSRGDHEHEHETVERSASAVAATTRPSHPLLAIQRSAGNRAASRMTANGAHRGPSSAVVDAVVRRAGGRADAIQREPGAVTVPASLHDGPSVQPRDVGRYLGDLTSVVYRLEGSTAGLAAMAQTVSAMPPMIPGQPPVVLGPASSLQVQAVQLINSALTAKVDVDLVLNGFGSVMPVGDTGPVLRRLVGVLDLIQAGGMKAARFSAVATSLPPGLLAPLSVALRELATELLDLAQTLTMLKIDMATGVAHGPKTSTEQASADGAEAMATAMGSLSTRAMAAKAMLDSVSF